MGNSEGRDLSRPICRRITRHNENKQYVVDASLINMIIFANNFYINRFKKQKRNLTDIEIFNSD